MLKLIVNWLDSFLIGHDAIDRDHREIFTVMAEVETHIGRRDHLACLERFAHAADLIARHFEAEETLLRDLGYPGLKAHMAYHLEMMARAETVMGLCEQKLADPEDVTPCFEELIRFLIDDIIRGDLVFKSFLVECGEIAPAHQRNVGA